MTQSEQILAELSAIVIEFFIKVVNYLSFIFIFFICICVVVYWVQKHLARRKVLRVMNENNGDCSFNQLVQKTGLDKNEVEDAVAELKRDGLIKEVKDS
jgi:hypothetical protein